MGKLLLSDWQLSNAPFNKAGASWWCNWCEKRVLVEANPDWVRDGYPVSGEGDCPYEWITRCPECWETFRISTGFECPECGWDRADTDTYTTWDEKKQHLVIDTSIPDNPFRGWGPRVSNLAVAMEFGGDPFEWEEKWTCPICGAEFSNFNSNY
jgi:rubrerythrin